MPAAPIQYGMRIRISHVASRLFLRSLEVKYQHKESSQQRMIVCSGLKDDSTLWLVKPSHAKLGVQTKERVCHGDIVRLENVSTKKNLHSHTKPSPFAVSHGHNQQEVTGFQKMGSGVGNEDDDWIVQLDVPSEWTSEQPFALKHVTTGAFLHSHGLADPHATEGQQEVTAIPAPDSNSSWVCFLENNGSEGTVAAAKPSPNAGASSFEGVDNPLEPCSYAGSPVWDFGAHWPRIGWCGQLGRGALFGATRQPD